jgi:ABC-type microcin C transport system duplicated ATPase subunit YejF
LRHWVPDPESSVKPVIEAQVLNLLIDLKQRFDLTYIFISHDLNVVRFISDRVMGHPRMAARTGAGRRRPVLTSPAKLAPLNVLHQPQQSSVHSSAVGFLLRAMCKIPER